ILDSLQIGNNLFQFFSLRQKDLL
ncbi:EPSP synthase family protein, partial [Chlamydia psittaci 84-8471/1]